MNETNERKKVLKELIRQLHAGVKPDEVKERFKQLIRDLTPAELSRVEQELTREGVTREELQKLCELHLSIFRETLEKQKIAVPSDHPVKILMEEHKIMLKLPKKLEKTINEFKETSDVREIERYTEKLKHIVKELIHSERHYEREENVLFPYLERHGITEPPAIMWMEHDRIRDLKKRLKDLTEKVTPKNVENLKRIEELAKSLDDMLSSHFFKENNILFPTALKLISSEEWVDIRREFDEIGYCCFTPKQLATPIQVKGHLEEKRREKQLSGKIEFETGTLSREELEALLNTLPVDITFVDKDDRVKYFNKAEERIFVRTKAVLGRKVQLCHPQKSVHIVNMILESFKSGEKDVAEFWIRVRGRLVHIRYFAVRDEEGKYLGTLEVTQDITDIKKIEGEKRLLDWKTTK